MIKPRVAFFDFACCEGCQAGVFPPAWVREADDVQLPVFRCGAAKGEEGGLGVRGGDGLRDVQQLLYV